MYGMTGLRMSAMRRAMRMGVACAEVWSLDRGDFRMGGSHVDQPGPFHDA